MSNRGVEKDHLRELERYAILDRPPEPRLDRIAALVARLFHAPIASIAFLDEHRQWFKSSYGLDLRETPREGSFCEYALRGEGVLMVPDTAQDPRFAGNPLVVSPPHVRFCACAPLRAPGGSHSGALCVLDTAPRRPLSQDDQASLVDLASMVVDELELELAERAAGEQRLAAREELQQANETIRAIIHASPVPIWALDHNGNVKFWNTAAEKTFGWTEEEALNCWPPFIRKQDREDYASMIARSNRGEVFRGMERRHYRRDGSPVDVNIWTAPMRDSKGAIIGTIGVVLDVTEKKHLQEQLLHSQKMEAIALLAGGVAHDFNNLLTVILGYCRMMMLDVPAGSALREYADEILYAAERASSLTSQLLAFSRRQITQPRLLDLNQVVQSMDKMLRRILGEDIELRTTLEPQLGTVRMDPGQLEQVIANLAVNARDAMPSGGRLLIETANVELDEAYVGEHPQVQTGPYVLLAINDTGCGMTPEIRSHVFEPFFTTKEKGKGTGLGLSIIYGIVKQNNGEIWVYSEPGRGSTFRVYLPRLDQPAEAPERDTRAEALPTGSETVLVVEDEESVQKLVAEILRKRGYTVLEAGGADEALHICESYRGPIDLMITDVIMPGITGPELTEQAVRLRPEMRLILISGYTEKAVVPDGTANFLQKPFTPQAVARKVREVLGLKST